MEGPVRRVILLANEMGAAEITSEILARRDGGREHVIEASVPGNRKE